MKALLTQFVIVLASINTFAQAELPMVDAPSDDQVVQSINFKGPAGVIAQAAILQIDESAEPTLMITHQKKNDVRYAIVLETDSLGLVVDGMAGVGSELAVAKNGSLQIHQYNESVGRDRWSRTLTVAYRDGQYVIAGFTFSAYDTLKADSSESCDYNLLTGKGIRNGRKVKISTSALPLATAGLNENLYSCKNW